MREGKEKQANKKKTDTIADVRQAWNTRDAISLLVKRTIKSTIATEARAGHVRRRRDPTRVLWFRERRVRGTTCDAAYVAVLVNGVATRRAEPAKETAAR